MEMLSTCDKFHHDAGQNTDKRQGLGIIQTQNDVFLPHCWL